MLFAVFFALGEGWGAWWPSALMGLILALSIMGAAVAIKRWGATKFCSFALFFSLMTTLLNQATRREPAHEGFVGSPLYKLLVGLAVLTFILGLRYVARLRHRWRDPNSAS